MATQTTKTFLQLVNDTIDEAGEDLASFSADGSNFLTQTDPMMNRFKKWVARAWRAVQQECFDWEWMQAQAIVNITPGIMFYTASPTPNWSTAINPAVIVDVDGSVVVDGLTVAGIRNISDATLVGALDKYLGYMDISYTDYITNNSHTLDFGLKAGGERITREDDGKIRFMMVANKATAYEAASFMEIGDTVNSLTIENLVNSATTVCTLTNGKLENKTVTDAFVTLEVSYASANNNPFTTLTIIATAAVSEFRVELSLDVETAAGNKIFDGTIRFDDIGNQFLLSCALTPINYSVNFTAPVGIGTDIRIGDVLSYTYNSTTHLGDIRVILGDVNIEIVDMFPSTTALGGILNVNINGDSGISIDATGIDGVYLTCWTFWTSLLFAQAPICQANLPGIIFYRADSRQPDGTFVFGQGVVLGLYDVLTPLDLASWTYTYQQPYQIKNYVHSWKSYNWDEELGTDDFVKNVREVNQTTFKITRHENEAPVADLPLQFIPWSSFENMYDLPSLQPGLPRLVTEDNTGRWRFYPPPDRPYTVQFNYAKQAQELVNHYDTPRGLPQEYSDLIMWRALQYYGEYDEQPSVANRGRGNYKNLLNDFELQTRPKPYLKARQLY